MEKIKGLVDDFGIIKEVVENVPTDFRDHFLRSLAELELNDNYIYGTFPVSRFHKMQNTDEEAFRFDIDKISGWRVIAVFGKDKRIHLIALSYPNEHDDPGKVVKKYKYRFEE